MDSVFESIFADISAFVYRCRNDSCYTMDYMAGAVEHLTGRGAEDIVANAKTTFVGMILHEDHEKMFKIVDDAIAANRAWNITYRFVHPDGRHKWVRERGSAVYVDGDLAYLQGMVVGAGTEYALRQQMHEQVEGTRTASAQIVDLTEQITSSVQELAMLSINARIEAARSGEAGKGFAVVANEIKMLADRNAGFAEMIADEVQGLNDVLGRQ